jgi:hypothetical protein
MPGTDRHHLNLRQLAPGPQMMKRDHSGTGKGDFNFGFRRHDQKLLLFIHRKVAKCAEKSYFMFAVERTANIKDNAYRMKINI